MKKVCFGRNLSEVVVLCCISSSFGELSTTQGKMTYVLPHPCAAFTGPKPFSRDLHVLGAPLTFVLSQDQTLQFESFGECSGVNPPHYHYALLSFRILTRPALRNGEARTS